MINLLVILGDTVVLFSMLSLANKLSEALIVGNYNKLKILLAFSILHYSDDRIGKGIKKCITRHKH